MKCESSGDLRDAADVLDDGNSGGCGGDGDLEEENDDL